MLSVRANYPTRTTQVDAMRTLVSNTAGLLPVLLLLAMQAIKAHMQMRSNEERYCSLADGTVAPDTSEPGVFAWEYQNCNLGVVVIGGIHLHHAADEFMSQNAMEAHVALENLEVDIAHTRS